MSGGIFDLMGIDFEGNGVIDERTKKRRREAPGIAAVEEGVATPEEGLLINGLLGLTAPVDPGKDFREYMGSQDGAKGFFGSVLNPILSRAIFGDEYDDYKTAKANYATDQALFDIAVAGRTQEAKNSAGDAQNSVVADLARRGITSGPLWDAAIIEAAGVSPYDANDFTLSQGGVRFDHQNNVVAYNAKDPQLSTAQRNLQQWEALNPEPPAGTPEHAKWSQDRSQFFSSAVRANQVVSNVVRSGTDGAVIGQEQDYHDSSAANTSAIEGAKTGVQTSARMFTEAKAGAEEAYSAVQEYDFSLQNANEVLAGLESGKYNTNIARSMMLDYLGLGSVPDGELLAMGTDEAIQKVQGFNGHTTDFEYGQAFNAAFAQLKNNTDVNIGVMRDVIKGLENARVNAANAYQSNVYDATNAAQQTVEKRWVERMDGRNKEKYPKAPKIGFEREGRRYMGGDPTDIRNWLEIQQ